MKGLFKQTIWFIFMFLVMANAYLFINGMKMSHEINQYESQIQAIHKQNLDLEKKAYLAESLTYATSMAAQLQFTKKLTPMYLQDKAFAKNTIEY